MFFLGQENFTKEILFLRGTFSTLTMCVPSGINVKSILNNAAMVKKKFDKNTRSVQVAKAASHLVEALDLQRELKTCKRLDFSSPIAANFLMSTS